MPRPTEYEVETTSSLSLAATPNGGIVVATDGTHDSDGSVRVGLALARRDEVPVDLLSVVEPLVVYSADGIAASDVDRLTSISRESLEAALRAQRDRTHPGAVDWPYTIDVGGRVDRIVAKPNAVAPGSSCWVSVRTV